MNEKIDIFVVFRVIVRKGEFCLFCYLLFWWGFIFDRCLVVFFFNLCFKMVDLVVDKKNLESFG